MTEALLLLLQSPSKRLGALFRLGVIAPMAIILWYETAGFLLDRATVALVAFLLTACYGAVLILTTVRVMSPAHGVSTVQAIVESAPAKTPRRPTRSLRSFALAEDEPQAAYFAEEPDSAVRFPLRG